MLTFVEQKEKPDDITIEEGKTPTCPNCGNNTAGQWIVLQKILRESKLVRVDNLRDLLVQTPDLSTYQQALSLECEVCGSSYFPQADIKAHEELNAREQIEAYSESLYEFPAVVSNEVQY